MKAWLKRWLFRTAAVLTVLGAFAFLGVALGLVPIKASAGHWPPTEWFLQFAKYRSVAMHSRGIDVPPGLDDPVLVLRGAGHYEGGCAPCHGAPSAPDPLIPERMLPDPPDLLPALDKLSPKELFYVVKHGLKFTGMPSWPAERRDDEVWALVAFMLQLPELDRESYGRLARGEPAPSAAEGDPEVLADLVPPPSPPLAVVESCARCHGFDGGGRGIGAFPRIDGQQVEYLFGAMRAYAEEDRPSGIMGPVAGGLESTAWRQLAEYYGAREDRRRSRQGTPATAAGDAVARERGAAIASLGIPEQRVPSCQDCHGPTAEPRNPAYPELAGQYVEYLELQLRLFKQGARGGSRYAHLMQKVAPRLTEDQIRDVALYYASLPAERLRDQADVGLGRGSID